MEINILIIAAIFVVAILYSSVGHGGASGYLAVMAFFAIAPITTRPTALILNVFVAAIGTFQFYRRGHFDWKVFLSFAATSIPFAFIGGMILLPTPVYKKILGAVLLFAAFRLAWKFANESEEIVPPKIWIALIVGAFIGLLSGLIGVGGGIFLTPILLLMNWTEAKTSRRDFGNVHSRQFDCGTSWKLCTGCRTSIECNFLDNCGGFWWYNRDHTRQSIF